MILTEQLTRININQKCRQKDKPILRFLSLYWISRSKQTFEDSAVRTARNFPLTVEIKDYNNILDEQNLFHQRVKNDLKHMIKFKKITTDKRYDDTAGCLLDYSYFKKYDKSIATDLSKQQVLDADPNAIQQINFTGNLDQAENTTKVFIIEAV